MLFLLPANRSAPVEHAELVLSVADQQEDFVLLRNKLEKNHPNLYLYTAKEKMNAYFDSVYGTINRPATSLEFLNKITPVYTRTNDGHTFFIPGASDINYFNRTAKFLPFDLNWIDGKLVLIHSCTNDTSIHAGAEIVSINGVSGVRIMDTLLQRQVRDGQNPAYPEWILNRWFREYYSYSFGHPEVFAIVCKDRKGMQVTRSCNGLSKDSIRYYRMRNYGMSSAYTSTGISFKRDSLHQTAVLTIGSFDNKILNGEFHQKFKALIPDIMNELIRDGYKNLILDVRNNQGGDPANGKFLLSYLLDKPFELVHKGPSSGSTSPQKTTFNGSVICLINGGSFSVTGMLCACLELHTRARFVGEETGGNNTIVSGSATSFHLPHSKIYCEVSRKTWQVVDRPNAGRGTIPFHVQHLSAADLIQSRDSQMEVALSLVPQ